MATVPTSSLKTPVVKFAFNLHLSQQAGQVLFDRWKWSFWNLGSQEFGWLSHNPHGRPMSSARTSTNRLKLMAKAAYCFDTGKFQPWPVPGPLFGQPVPTVVGVQIGQFVAGQRDRVSFFPKGLLKLEYPNGVVSVAPPRKPIVYRFKKLVRENLSDPQLFDQKALRLSVTELNWIHSFYEQIGFELPAAKISQLFQNRLYFVSNRPFDSSNQAVLTKQNLPILSRYHNHLAYLALPKTGRLPFLGFDQVSLEQAKIAAEIAHHHLESFVGYQYPLPKSLHQYVDGSEFHQEQKFLTWAKAALTLRLNPNFLFELIRNEERFNTGLGQVSHFVRRRIRHSIPPHPTRAKYPRGALRDPSLYLLEQHLSDELKLNLIEEVWKHAVAMGTSALNQERQLHAEQIRIRRISAQVLERFNRAFRRLAHSFGQPVSSQARLELTSLSLQLAIQGMDFGEIRSRLQGKLRDIELTVRNGGFVIQHEVVRNQGLEAYKRPYHNPFDKLDGQLDREDPLFYAPKK